MTCLLSFVRLQTKLAKGNFSQGLEHEGKNKRTRFRKRAYCFGAGECTDGQAGLLNGVACSPVQRATHKHCNYRNKETSLLVANRNSYPNF